MNDLRVPGVSVAIIRDARIAWKRSFGLRDRSTGVPVDDDTVFSAQSMSKPVFAYRVMKLWEQGVLDLDAPLTRYTRDVFVKDDPRLDEITARRVLSHTTGLPNWRSNEEPLRISFTPGTKWSYSGEGFHERGGWLFVDLERAHEAIARRIRLTEFPGGPFAEARLTLAATLR